MLALLGAGGMGEVFRVRDLRLGREVAIKLLRPAMGAHPARVRRFEQEARRRLRRRRSHRVDHPHRRRAGHGGLHVAGAGAGHPLDFRSDQFSFGTVVYEMLSARRAFFRPTPVATLSAILHEEPEPLASAAPGVPAELAWIVERSRRRRGPAAVPRRAMIVSALPCRESKSPAPTSSC